jgi:16S rRNA A1518/A1519 N6-dimethyltransferase RsmA/KsgA/DIM1 with predicted DNA glycosylase/AP lyase activity
MIILPEYVPGRWWEHLLHNQTALRLKAALLFHPGIIVANVPYHVGPDAVPA